MKFALTAAFITSVLPLALGYCCGGDGSGICGDGTTQGAGCCGYGPCNIFCCNCDPQPGNCRGGRGNKRDALPMSPNVPAAFVDKRVDAGTSALFNEVSSGADAMTLDAYLAYMKVSEENKEIHDYWVSWFNQHDTNGDGVIDLEEAA